MAKFASRYVIARPQRLVDKIKMFFEIKKSFKKTTFYGIYTTMYWDGRVNYNVGDRVAQMVILPYPKVTFVEKEELSETDRGEGGYGSTGN
jgi:hypothetical protein